MRPVLQRHTVQNPESPATQRLTGVVFLFHKTVAFKAKQGTPLLKMSRICHILSTIWGLRDQTEHFGRSQTSLAVKLERGGPGRERVMPHGPIHCVLQYLSLSIKKHRKGGRITQ